MKTEPNQLAHSFNHAADTEGNFNGLTKREYFAAMAMQGYCSGVTSNLIIANAIDKESSSLGISNHDYIAKESVRAADSLIKALNL